MPSERRKTTLTGKAPRKRENKYQKHECFGPDGDIYCFCDRTPRLRAVLRTTTTDKNGNLGREFYSCADQLEDCGFFLWADGIAKYGGPYPGAGRRLGESEDEIIARLGDGYITPPPSSQHMTRTPSSDLPKSKKRTVTLDSSDEDAQASPSRGKKVRGKKVRVARSPSPDWPDTEELEKDLQRTKRALKTAERELKACKQKNEEPTEENQELLKRLYPEAFEVKPQVGSSA